MKKIFVMVSILLFIGVGLCHAGIDCIVTEAEIASQQEIPDTVARDLVEKGVIPEEQSGDIRVGTPDVRDKPITRSQAITTENPQVNPVRLKAQKVKLNN